MAIDQPRDHHASLAIKFLYFFSIRSEPWIAEQFAPWAGSQNLSATAQDSRIFY